MQHPYAEALASAARRSGGRIAVIDQDGPTTYAELARRVSALASYLIESGLAAGDRVAIVQKNGRRYMESVCAVARAGAVYVPMLGLLPDADHDFIVSDSGATIVICLDPAAAPRCRRFLDQPQVHHVMSVASAVGIVSDPVVRYEAAVACDDTPGLPAADAAPGTAAQILYTSGTTGRPKGVVHSRAAVAAAMEGWSHWTRMQEGDVVLGQFALSHFGGRLMDAGWSNAATVVVCGTDAGEILAVVEQYRVNIVLMVPTLMQSVVDHADVARRDLRSLRTIVYAAAPASAGLVARTMQAFPRVGLVTGFGQTEAYGLNTLMSADEHWQWLQDNPARLGSIGRANEGFAEVKLVDDEGRRVSEAGCEGELCVRAPWVMSGYWQRREESARVLRDGWLRTRDIARCDEDGYLYICDRKHDVIISGGQNVFPREIEEILQAHPAVLECCVIGRPDKRWGEAVVAVIVRRSGASVSAAELVAHCRSHLPGFKTPKVVHFLTELPKSAVGKILRREVRKPYWQEAEGSVHGVE